MFRRFSWSGTLKIRGTFGEEIKLVTSPFKQRHSLTCCTGYMLPYDSAFLVSVQTSEQEDDLLAVAYYAYFLSSITLSIFSILLSVLLIILWLPDRHDRPPLPHFLHRLQYVIISTSAATGPLQLIWRIEIRL